MTESFSVATFNLHGGIDAWGRRYDALGGVAALDADITFLQECWTTEGDPPFASQVAKALGAQSVESTMAVGRRAQPHPEAPTVWHRRRSFLDGDHGLYLESELPLSESITKSDRYANADPGVLSLALVSRFPILSTEVVSLGRLRKDRSQRAFIKATLDVGETKLLAVSTHMTHLTYGSPVHFRRLRKDLRHHASMPIILGGDMNLWGPAVSLQLPTLRRAVRGKTWPSWGPHSQLDHLMVNRYVKVVGGHVEKNRGSDHLPVVATCVIDSVR